MKNFIIKNHRTLFYTAWFILGVIQSRYTELMDDEAFYWAYSRFPAFGYFEHPPLIALFTGAGYWLFKNELGVRFFIVILNGLHFTNTAWVSLKCKQSCHARLTCNKDRRN